MGKNERSDDLDVKSAEGSRVFERLRAHADINLEGHLIDSFILPKVLGLIYDHDANLKFLDFHVGETEKDYSQCTIRIFAENEEKLSEIISELQVFGAVVKGVEEDVILEAASADGVLPDSFYSTTHHETFIRLGGSKLLVENPEMDKAIVVRDGRAFTVPISRVKKGDMVVTGSRGIKVVPPARPRRREIFEFMASTASSEKPSTTYAKLIAKEILEAKRGNGKIVIVAGPAIIHSGARDALAELIRKGYVDALLSGNALAVHDVEYSLYGTSLGMNLKSVETHEGGHRHHMAAINEVRKVGALREAVEKGVLKSGIFYECIKKNVPYVLAGSIRDDGPIPDVITDVVEAQDAMRKHLRNASLVLMMATALHSIAVGNLLPSKVRTIVIDISQATVTKLLDRGTMHAVGIVTDVGIFLPTLLSFIKRLENEEKT
ncbi:MAG: TIGR00300 family protein [Candidatus Hodarchaeota archaeon]